MGFRTGTRTVQVVRLVIRPTRTVFSILVWTSTLGIVGPRIETDSSTNATCILDTVRVSITRIIYTESAAYRTRTS